MDSPSITLLLDGLWEFLSDEWKSVLAENLELEGCFTRNDIDYILTLKELDCSGSGIKDLYPLYFMPQLEYLDMSETKVTNFRPVESLSNLKSLDATFCNIRNTAAFSKFQNLEVLDISYPVSYRVDLNGLKNLSNLRELYCNGCAINSLDCVYELSNLKTLSVFFNAIEEQEIQYYRAINPSCWILK